MKIGSTPITDIKVGSTQITKVIRNGITYWEAGWTPKYYVSNAGNDANDGLTPATAWQTIAKVNATSFVAGDGVGFKKGDIWREALTIPSSGTAERHITFGAYGIGNKPKLSGLATLISWTDNGGGVYYATLDVPRLNIVTLDGVVKGMGRYPDAGYLHYELHNAKLSITDNQLTDSPDWTGAEIGIRKPRWIIDRHVVTDHTNGTLTYNSLGDYGNNTAYEPIDLNGYFFQNHLGCLDDLGDWCYDAAANRLYMQFSGGVPESYIIKAGSSDRNLIINTKNYIDFANIDFEGANIDGVNITGSTHINLTNCNFISQGGNAIYGIFSDYIIITGGSITDALNNGIFFELDVDNVTVDGLVVTNAGNILGASKSGDGAAVGINVNGNNTIVRNCRISNTGYIGINFSGNDCLIENNYINNTNLVKDDGAGIYTYGAEYTGRIIRNNIVLNSIGSYAGAEAEYWEPWGKAGGIYLDGYSSNVEVSGNTIANCSWSGIFINGGASNNILNNTVYNNLYQFEIYSETDHLVRNTIVTGNKFISKTATQLCYYLNSTVDENPSLTGIYDNNFYGRPIDDRLTFSLYTPSSGWIYKSLGDWQEFSAEDINSRKCFSLVDDASNIEFYYNDSTIPITVALNQPMIDIEGTEYITSVGLNPFGSVILLPIPPNGNPSALELSVISSSQIDLAWVNSSTDEDGFRIERSNNGIDFTIIHTTISGVNTYSDTELAEGTLNYYRLRGYKNDGYSNYTDIVSGETASRSATEIIGDVNETVAWYITDDLTTITKDGSNKITHWNDKNGTGHDLTNDGTADFTPTWSSSGIAFDGAYNYLAGTFSNNQPCFIYMVIKIASTNSEYNALFNGVGGANNGVCSVYNFSTTPRIMLSAGSSAGYPFFVPDSYIILRVLINGASSKVTVNTGTPATGNAGINNMGGFTLGSSVGVAYGGSHSEIEVKEIIVRKTADGTAVEDKIYNYLKTKYSL